MSDSNHRADAAFISQLKSINQSTNQPVARFPFPITGSTVEVHSDASIELTADVAPPLHPTTTFKQTLDRSSTDQSIDLAQGQIYSRQDNITRRRVEKVIESIELKSFNQSTNQSTDQSICHSVLYSSGLSAATAMIHCIRPRTIYFDAGYHGVKAAFKHWKDRQINQSADQSIKFLTLDECKKLYETHTEIFTGNVWWQNSTTSQSTDQSTNQPIIDLIWLESPNNPYTSLVDVEWFVKLARNTGACVVIDSTLSSPLGMQPINQSINQSVDVVMHSCTKYLSGHSDLLGGVLTVRPGYEKLVDRLRTERLIDGAVMGNLEQWLLLRSLRTLSLRVKQQTSSALKLARWLDEQRANGRKITAVHHPCLPTHPSHHLSEKYLLLPPATFSFVLESEKQAKTFAKSLVLAAQATSLGGVETLIDWRYLYDTSVSPALLRVSVGVEEIEDLLQDFEQALEKC